MSRTPYESMRWVAAVQCRSWPRDRMPCTQTLSQSKLLEVPQVADVTGLRTVVTMSCTTLVVYKILSFLVCRPGAQRRKH